MIGAPGTPVTLRDGRRLWIREYGDASGAPVVYCHGFPGSGLEARFAHDAACRLGIRLIAPDRPGFGGSSPHPLRTLAGWPRDLAAALETLRIDRVDVLGVSGGGPYALAAAAALDGRVRRVALVGPLGDLSATGATAGMSTVARIAAYLARHNPGLQAGLFRLMGGVIRIMPAGALRLSTLGLAAVDRKLFAQSRLRDMWMASIRASVAQGADAAIGEMRLYTHGWDFDLDAIRQPVDLWHGDADRVVPIGHARRIAGALPRARLHELEGEGHFSTVITRVESILGALVAPGQSGPARSAEPPQGGEQHGDAGQQHENGAGG